MKGNSQNGESGSKRNYKLLSQIPERKQEGCVEATQRQLIDWVKWEKDLYKKAAIRYLKTKYQEQPNRFVHWLLVNQKVE